MIAFSNFTGSAAPAPERWQFFAPPQFAALPAAHRDQLFFLNPASTRAAYEAADAHQVVCGDNWGNDPFAGGCYPSVERFALRGVPPPRAPKLKKWLYRRGVAFAAAVLVLPAFRSGSTLAVLSTWKMFLKYPEEFLGGDNLLVVGSSADWCLHYHHDGVFHHASGRYDRPRKGEGA